jgi:hypothetical protein
VRPQPLLLLLLLLLQLARLARPPLLPGALAAAGSVAPYMYGRMPRKPGDTRRTRKRKQRGATLEECCVQSCRRCRTRRSKRLYLAIMALVGYWNYGAGWLDRLRFGPPLPLPPLSNPDRSADVARLRHENERIQMALSLAAAATPPLPPGPPPLVAQPVATAVPPPAEAPARAPPQLPAPSPPPRAECVGWRQTGGCDPGGVREPAHDLGCAHRVRGASSGYCECRGGAGRQSTWRANAVGCWHKEFTCALVRGLFAGPPPGAAQHTGACVRACVSQPIPRTPSRNHPAPAPAAQPAAGGRMHIGHMMIRRVGDPSRGSCHPGSKRQPPSRSSRRGPGESELSSVRAQLAQKAQPSAQLFGRAQQRGGWLPSPAPRAVQHASGIYHNRNPALTEICLRF